MKKLETAIKEYVSRLNFDNLKYLACRLNERMGSDLAEALDEIAKSQDLDRWLSASESHEEFYEIVDAIKDYVNRELDKKVPEIQAR